MKAIQYMKIDYILLRQQLLLMPLFVVIAFLLGKQEESMLTACMYMLFIATVFSAGPFGNCAKKEVGFLLLLPGTLWERVAGRFLFGLSLLAGGFAISVAGYRLVGLQAMPGEQGIVFLLLAFCILLMTFQYLFLYLVGEGRFMGAQLLNILRVAPGMVFFFIGVYATQSLREEQDALQSLEALQGKLAGFGPAAVGISLAFALACVWIIVKAVEKRDYA